MVDHVPGAGHHDEAACRQLRMQAERMVLLERDPVPRADEERHGLADPPVAAREPVRPGDEERRVGQEFVIDVTLRLDTRPAAASDDVADTVHYGDMAEQIAETELASGRTVIVDAVNAAESARLQWRDLAERTDVRLRVIEVVCSDPRVHRERLEKRERRLPHLDETTWRAVEQSLEGYAPWTGPSSALPRVTIDSAQPLGVNVEAALAFIAA